MIKFIKKLFAKTPPKPKKIVRRKKLGDFDIPTIIVNLNEENKTTKKTTVKKAKTKKTNTKFGARSRNNLKTSQQK